MNYGPAYGQQHQVPNADSWSATARPHVASKVPDNYYNYHNSLYESSTQQQVRSIA
jgi:hypothetical protein